MLISWLVCLILILIWHRSIQRLCAEIICFLEQVGGIKFAKARLAESIQGLEAFKAYKSMDSEYIEYFAMVEALSQVRYDPATYVAEGDTTDVQGSSLFDDSLYVYYQYKDYCDSQKHSCPHCRNTASGSGARSISVLIFRYL